jgi:hypothetical protein
MQPYLRIIFVLAISGLVCWLVYIPLSKGMDRYYWHVQEHCAEVFESKAPHDILFIGSSRTHRSIDPRIIDSICGTNSFNAGVEGGHDARP